MNKQPGIKHTPGPSEEGSKKEKPTCSQMENKKNKSISGIAQKGKIHNSDQAQAGKKRRKIIPYNPKLKELARSLRNHSTKSEIILWKHLKGKQMFGYDFHRQKPIDNYILDFFCHELMLGIELDGYSHQLDEVIKKDARKEKRMNDLGISVLRFKDAEVYRGINNVLRAIELYIVEWEQTHPQPLSRGE